MITPESAACVLNISGDLTIRGVAGLHNQLIEAIGGNSSVVAQISEDAAIDLTFIQLMEAARRAAAESGVDFTLAEPARGALREALQRGGFIGEADVGRRQFWLMETGTV